MSVSRTTVPSKALLRFLRSQTNPLCVSAFKSNSTPFPKSAGQFKIDGKTQQRPLSSTCKHRIQTRSSTSCTTQHRSSRSALSSLQPAVRIQTRHASKDSRSDSLFWRMLRQRPTSSNENDNHHDETSAQLFNLSRALSRSPVGGDLKLRCTEFDANGSVTLVSGEFKKSELIAKYGLLPRDLRKIDSSVLPHILVRPTAILLSLLHLRVLIQSDRVLVFDAYGSTDSYTQSLFMYDLEGKLRQKPDPRNRSMYLPYEMRALEAVLISVTSGLEAEFALIREPVTNILRELEDSIDRDKLRHLLITSKKLGTFEQKARLVRDAIDDLLEADDDLAAMYLTERKQTGEPRSEDDHQEVEMLLESYHKICDEIVEISGALITSIRNTEEVVRAILDANRNQLMLLDLKFSIGTLGLAAGTLIAGLYGMNLNNFIEETNWGFGGITTICFGLTGVVFLVGMRKLRAMQKVRMWGEGVDVISPNRGKIGGRGNWRNEAMEYHALLRHKKAAEHQQHQGHKQGGATGPVLWPGMDGLEMHKLNSSNLGSDHRSETLDTNSDADAVYDKHDHSNYQDSAGPSRTTAAGPSMTIRDDLHEDAEGRLLRENQSTDLVEGQKASQAAARASRQARQNPKKK